MLSFLVKIDTTVSRNINASLFSPNQESRLTMNTQTECSRLLSFLRRHAAADLCEAVESRLRGLTEVAVEDSWLTASDQGEETAENMIEGCRAAGLPVGRVEVFSVAGSGYHRLAQAEGFSVGASLGQRLQTHFKRALKSRLRHDVAKELLGLVRNLSKSCLGGWDGVCASLEAVLFHYLAFAVVGDREVMEGCGRLLDAYIDGYILRGFEAGDADTLVVVAKAA